MGPRPPIPDPVTARRLIAYAALFVVGAQQRTDAQPPAGADAVPAETRQENTERRRPGETGHSYRIRAVLQPSSHRIRGEQRIRWQNHSDGPVDTLYLHLYLNAFEHDDTVFMRESGGQLRGAEAHGRGSIRLESLRLADGTDLLEDATGELIEGDRTQMKVPLPAPLAPGERVVLETSFLARLPPLFARAGYVDQFHMAGQWFPKLARLEPDGEWAHFPYHGMGEFYADFANYDLELETPPGWIVGATGRRLARRRENGRSVHRFVAHRVHDVAFVAWPHFRQRSVDVEEIELRVLYPPGYDAAAERHVETTRAGLAYFQDLYGRYPYTTLTLIVPPRGAGGAAGMEYPMLFVTAGPWFTVPGIRMGMHEEITAHELAHQWFQGLIATNEVRWPMLDEGLTQWACWDFLRHRHGRHRSAFGPPWPAIDGFEALRMAALRLGPTPPPGRPAYEFDRSEYGRSVYARTAVVLETIARTWGRSRLHRALGRYAHRHRFDHPDPDALFEIFDEVYWQGFSARILNPALMEGATASNALHSLTADPSGSRVVAAREDELALPSTLRLYFADGRSRTLPWSASRTRLEHESDTGRIVGARIDPHRHNLLDRTIVDDAKRLERPSALTGLAPLLGLWQSLLGWLGP